VEYGRLLHLRLDGQNMIAVNMPHTLLQDSDLTLIVEYSGRVESQSLDIDTVRADSLPERVVTPESKYLLSNRSYWYPQNPIGDYATASLRLTVPNDFRVVASGEPVADAGVAATDGATAQSGNTFSFRANQPLRYLAFVVSRMSKVAERQIDVSTETAGAGGDSIAMTIEANPRLQSRGRNYQQPTEDILRFYTSLVGDAPYASAAIALTEVTCLAATARPIFRWSTNRPNWASQPGATIRRPSTDSPSSSSRTSWRISGGARPSAGRTTTSSGCLKGSRSISPRCTRRKRGEIASSSTCCASSAVSRWSSHRKDRSIWGTGSGT
jgi:hypothetical protein